jgi:hypothetical protein
MKHSKAIAPWFFMCLVWFGLGCLVGLESLRFMKPKPRPFPPGYGRSPAYYFEPSSGNNYRFDI